MKKQAGRPKGSKNKPKQAGRPSSFHEIIVTILKEDTLEEMSKNKERSMWDMAIPVEKALKRVLPKGVNIFVQTQGRILKLSEQGINYTFDNTSPIRLIRLNGRPLKFPWELTDYMTHFISRPEYIVDYVFKLNIPKDWNIL